MTRGLSGAAITASQAPNVAPIMLVEMHFDSGTVRFCTAAQDFAWNGYTWLALGQLGQVDVVREAEMGQISGLSFELSSIPSGLLSSALTEQYQGRAVTVWVGFCALPTYQVIADPVVEWAGTLDVCTVSDDGKTGSIKVTAESEMYDYARPQPSYWGDNEQQALYPGDKGCQYVPQMASRPLIWPSAAYFRV